MKIGPESAQKLKKLIATMKREGLKSRIETPTSDEPLEVLMIGTLARCASEARAVAALTRLRGLVVDINELRVTSVAEMVEMLGVDYPAARTVGESLSRVLISIYNRRHALDLSFLKALGKTGAENFLDSLDGLDPHAKALIMLRCLDAHAVPVDDLMLAYLRRGEIVPEDASYQDIEAFLQRQIKHADAEDFYQMFKRFASSHASRGGPAKPSRETVPPRRETPPPPKPEAPAIKPAPAAIAAKTVAKAPARKTSDAEKKSKPGAKRR